MSEEPKVSYEEIETVIDGQPVTIVIKIGPGGAFIGTKGIVVSHIYGSQNEVAPPKEDGEVDG